MSKIKNGNQVESFRDKINRLRKRKRDFQATYAKGVYFTNKLILKNFIDQNDVVIRCRKSGVLDDETLFIEVSIEGFNSENSLTQWLEQ